MGWEVVNGKLYHNGRKVTKSLSMKTVNGEEFVMPADVKVPDVDSKRFWKRLGEDFQVEKIIASGPVVTIIWKDREKTRVKLDECSDYSIYFAFCSAVCKKLFGNNSTIKREISNHLNVDWDGISDEAFDDLINYVEAPEWCYE